MHFADGSGQTLSGSAGHCDFSVRMNLKAIKAFVFGGDRLAQFCLAPGEGILVDALLNGPAGGVLDLGGSGKTRKSMSRADGLVSNGQSGHFPDDQLGESGGSVTDSIG